MNVTLTRTTDSTAAARARRAAILTHPAVSLDRNLPVPGIDYRPDCAYRMIGDAGFRDLVATGHIRPHQERGKYDNVYFAFGVASSRYRRRATRYDYVAEVSGDLVELAGGGTPKRGDYVRATRPLFATDVTVYRIDNHTGAVDTVAAYPGEFDHAPAVL